MYSLAIYFYMFCVDIVSLFNTKARLLVRGHKDTYRILRKHIHPDEKYIWFHAASLGEFEQGRPLIEKVRTEYPNHKILLTFFSPSGYEVRKNYAGADVVCYLPFDTPLNARKFIRLAHPSMAFFIKYEFWMNYLNILRKKGIPAYSVSSIFRENQIFFRWYGKYYSRVLQRFTHFFVQNEFSRELLARKGITNVSVVGDTRFDRVIDIRHEAKDIPLIAGFSTGNHVLVAGSSWAPDEDIIIPYFNNTPGLKLIMAPHVVSEEHLAEIENKLKRPSVRFTKADIHKIQQADCILIDCYGLLSSIYRYGQIAYIGGGLGTGIHNVPEAAVYNVPVIIGPNNKKFREAQALLANGGCKEIQSEDDFNRIMNTLLSDKKALQTAGDAAGTYIRENAGATEAIFNSIEWL